MNRFCFGLLVLASLSNAALSRTSEDAYVAREGDAWTLGTAKGERTVRLTNGRLLTSSLKNKATGREALSGGIVSEEFRAVVNGQEVSGRSGDWRLVAAEDTTLAKGEIQLDVTLRRGGLEVTKSYVVYPGSSIIREWVRFKNAGDEPLRLSEPRFLNFTARVGGADSVDFHWLSGAENQPGSWMLKTEKFKPGLRREFDSYDPFGGTAEGNFIGDGVLARVLREDQQVWPAVDWQRKTWEYVANGLVAMPLDASVEVAAGERLIFILNKYNNPRSDRTAFDPTITYADGETHRASDEFSSRQGGNGWWYQYLEWDEARPGDSNFAGFWLKPKFLNLVYKHSSGEWRRVGDKNAAGTTVVGAAEMHPGSGHGAARVWVAPRAGKVRITGKLLNIGNQPIPGGGRGFHMGSSSYAPWNALMNRENGEGIFLGWDYFGHWASGFTQQPDGMVEAQFRVAGHEQILSPGESLTTPQAMVGLFNGDLDNAGNESLDWQYRYLWDYTREDWFPGIRLSGWWWKGTSWLDLMNFGVETRNNITIWGGDADHASSFRKVFRLADLLSQVGADGCHRDWGWWDRLGDWGGPDFKTMGAYLRKYGIGQLIYACVYTVDPECKVAREHPDWVVNNVEGLSLDMSKPEVVEFLERQLDEFVERFGPFQWKNDSVPTAPRGGDSPLLQQDQAFRRILRRFLDRHPDCAFQGVNGGGRNVGYDYVRYTSSGSFSDGPVGILRNHWAALVLPPDKTSENGDNWELKGFEKARYRGLLTLNFDMSGDTWDPEKLEGIRELIDIYHYLGSQGVVGRWVRVYRPQVSGDDPTMYFQRLSRDGARGIIIPKLPAPGAVTIRPKGLNRADVYDVSFHESQESRKQTGAELMETGIRLEAMAPGELIYLNLPYHPGNRLDRVPPSPPSQVRKALASNMGYPGVELSWSLGSDDHWISFYEVVRNDAVIGKVAKGSFYFDHSAGADVAAKYEVRTVDGAGLRSVLAAAAGPAAKPALILDDAPDGGLGFSGHWERQSHLQPAHAGTIARSDQKGAGFEFEFEAAKFTWFTKLGEDCGKAEIVIDGRRDAVIDTYSADDIWGVGVYSKTFPTAGRHTVKINVLGEQTGPRARWKGTFVHVDGVRIEERGPD